MESIFEVSAAWLTHSLSSRNSQKPTDELYAAFKQNFPTFSSINAAATSSAAAHGAIAVTSDGPNATLNPRSVTLHGCSY